MPTVLRVVCMWCKLKIGEKDGQGVEGDSHGVCRECWEKHYPAYPYPCDGKEQQ